MVPSGLWWKGLVRAGRLLIAPLGRIGPRDVLTEAADAAPPPAPEGGSSRFQASWRSISGGTQGFACARALDDPEWDLQRAVLSHLDMLDQQLSVVHALRQRLTGIAEALSGEATPSTEEFLEALEEMTMLDTVPHRRIGMLVYDDIPPMQSWLVRVFGLGKGRLAYDDAGNCVHGEVQAGDGVIWLHQGLPRFGLASPQSLGATTSTTAVMVEDVDAHHTHAVEAGAEIVYSPVDQPYGYREYSARDPEGGLWSFMKPLD